MAQRAPWNGYLKLSLVSCQIALYPASSSSERVSFNRISKKTGVRLKQQLVDPVEKDDVGRGYKVGKGQYLEIEDDEIEKIWKTMRSLDAGLVAEAGARRQPAVRYETRVDPRLETAD